MRTLSVSRETVRGHKTEHKYEREVQPTPKLGDWVAVLTEILEKEAKLPRRERQRYGQRHVHAFHFSPLLFVRAKIFRIDSIADEPVIGVSGLKKYFSGNIKRPEGLLRSFQYAGGRRYSLVYSESVFHWKRSGSSAASSASEIAASFVTTQQQENHGDTKNTEGKTL